MGDWLDQLSDDARLFVPRLVAALLILIVGWVIAALISGLIRAIFRRTTLDERIARAIGGDRTAGVNIGDLIARIVFWVLMLLVLLGALQALQLTLITTPINELLTNIFSYVPRILGAAVLLLIAWVVASVLRTVVVRVLTTARVDERVNEQTRIEPPAAAAQGAAEALPAPTAAPVSIAQSLGEVVYWLVFLLFLPAILSALQLPGLLAPVQNLVDRVLSFLPNLAAAAIILLVGWFVARLVQRIATGILASIGVDNLSERIGVAQVLAPQRLSGVIGLLLYFLILLPTIVAALDALQIASLSVPASNMVNAILTWVPKLLGAGLVLVIAYVLGRVIAGIVTNLLAGIGFDSILDRLGIARQTQPGERTPSELVGSLVLVGIMLLATIEAANAIGFTIVAELVAAFAVLAGRVALGVVILAIGLYLANLVAGAIQRSSIRQAELLALVARVAILVLAAAFALAQLGLANEIVILAFAIPLAAVAVAAAVAFGIGGRDIARRELERWTATWRGSDIVLPSGGPAEQAGTSQTDPSSPPPA